MRRRGKQTKLQDALAAAMRSLDKGSPGRLLQVRVAEAWAKVAGPVVASHTAKAHLHGSELVVQVDSPIWATELTALAGPYREAMNSELGRAVVETVRFRVSRELARGPGQVTGAGEGSTEAMSAEAAVSTPLSVEERAVVEQWASRIEDERLRELAIKVTVAGMERHRAQNAARSGRDEPGGYG